MRVKLFLISFLLLTVSVSALPCQDGQERVCGEYDLGICSYGIQYCENGQWSFCMGQKLPEVEVCGDGLDNDCDGYEDEGCECVSGDFRECGNFTSVGICEKGKEYCVDGEWSGDCLNATLPDAEKCGAQGTGDGLDNDCDGSVDEDCALGAGGVPLHCTDRVKNEDETGVDCGGSCNECNDCNDGILELDEKKTSIDLGAGVISDCGGLNCPKCPTCNDKVKNQGEEDVDCGGPCPAKCYDPTLGDEDGDGLIYSEELLKGTNPKNADSDGDGLKDGVDKLPLCPNSICGKGETEDNCPQDCKSESSGSGVLVVVMILVLLFFGVILFFYFNMKSSSKNVKKKSLGGFSDLESYVPKRENVKKRLQQRNFPRTYVRGSSRGAKAKQKETDIEKKLRKAVEDINKK